MLNKKLSLITACLLLVFISYTQEKTLLKDKIVFKGYLRFMETGSKTVFSNKIMANYLVHNRLNLKFYASDVITIAIESRNRLVFGDQFANGGYLILDDWLDTDPGLVDMSFNLLANEQVILNSIIDRIWVDWSKGDWEIRLGRQRVNWGINNMWNSNDVFNAFSFTDFDYTERPGGDAVRITKFMKGMRSIEVALKPGRTDTTWIGGAIYRWNKWNYDFQALAGIFNQNVFIGTGWAGNIKKIGFKGEATFFIADKIDLSSSISLDYITEKKIMFGTGYLLNTSAPRNYKGGALELLNQPLSAKNLMPLTHAMFVNVSYGFTPLLSGTVVLVGMPAVQGIFAMPSVSYSLANSVDFSIYGQLLGLNRGNGVELLSSSVFGRLAWSF